MVPAISRISISAPATIANLGAGYDCLAMALDFDNHFTLYFDDRQLEEGTEKEFTIELSGDCQNDDPNLGTKDRNLFIRAFEETRKLLCAEARVIIPRCPIFTHCDVRIPPMRGLGSSSSACVAGVFAAIRYLGAVYPERNFSRWLENQEYCASLAMAIDNCPDNVCACVSGGITYSFEEEPNLLGDCRPDSLHYFSEPIEDSDLFVVALVPTVPLRTSSARKLLEGMSYSVKDVSFNVTRSTCIPAVFRTRRYELLGEVLKDRVHQAQRQKEFYADERGKDINLAYIFEQVRDAGAYGACIGGAGSTLVAFSNGSKVAQVEQAFRKAFDLVTRANWKIDRIASWQPRNTGAHASDALPLSFESLPTSVSVWAQRCQSRVRTVKGDSQPSTSGFPSFLPLQEAKDPAKSGGELMDGGSASTPTSKKDPPAASFPASWPPRS